MRIEQRPILRKLVADLYDRLEKVGWTGALFRGPPPLPILLPDSSLGGGLALPRLDLP